MRKIKHLAALHDNPSLDPQLLKGVLALLHSYDPSFGMRMGVHFILFRSALEGGGTEEQIKKYADDLQ